MALYVSQIQASLYIDCSGPEHRPLSALPDRDLPDGDIAVARNVVTRDTVAVGSGVVGHVGKRLHSGKYRGAKRGEIFNVKRYRPNRPVCICMD